MFCPLLQNTPGSPQENNGCYGKQFMPKHSMIMGDAVDTFPEETSPLISRRERATKYSKERRRVCLGKSFNNWITKETTMRFISLVKLKELKNYRTPC